MYFFIELTSVSAYEIDEHGLAFVHAAPFLLLSTYSVSSSARHVPEWTSHASLVHSES